MRARFPRPLGLVLAVALGIVLGRGSIGTASAGQPNMQRALRLLGEAKAALSEATPDKAGHREAALQATEHALSETQEGISAGAK
jgi:hypothetical protein